MKTASFLLALALPAMVSATPVAPRAVRIQEAQPSFRERLADAGEEVEALWALHQWCVEQKLRREAKSVQRRILKIDPQHAPTHAALGHLEWDGQWFESKRALKAHMLERETEKALASGLVLYKKDWVHPDEIALLKAGLTRDAASRLWNTAAEVRQLKRGWKRQDLEWIAASDQARIEAGYWSIDGEWYKLDEANQKHSKIESMWQIPSAKVLIHSCADRAVTLQAARTMSEAFEDMRRVFGVEPMYPVHVALMRTEEQYDLFAAGDPSGRRKATHTRNLHTIHHAFFAESWFETEAGKLKYRGMGVALWDPLVRYGDRFGFHAARLAAGLSYVDAIDPSKNAVIHAAAAGSTAEHYDAFVKEKRIPEWLRYGAAVYAERYFRDPRATDDGDPWWAREWSFDNLRNHGELRDLDEIFGFPIKAEERVDSQKLLLEAGLLVSFMLDGGCAPLMEAHAALRKALAQRKPIEHRVSDIEAQLRAHRKELLAFGDV